MNLHTRVAELAAKGELTVDRLNDLVYEEAYAPHASSTHRTAQTSPRSRKGSKSDCTTNSSQSSSHHSSTRGIEMNDYQTQTPSMTLSEICDVLWQHGEHRAYRALRAYAKERDEMIKELKELKGYSNDTR